MRLVWVAAVACAIAVPSAGVAQRAPDLRKPSAKEWLSIGGDWGNTRYSTLAQINRGNVRSLKGAWVAHLGSGPSTRWKARRSLKTASCISRPATTTCSRSMPGLAR